MKEQVKVFKAIGDETRIKILILLSKRNMCAKGIAKHLEISEAAVSQHIKILKDVELIRGYKKGYYVTYDLNKEVLESSMDFLKVLLYEDISLINTKLNINDFNMLRCQKSCKATKGCCKRLLEEE
ncbi:regulatory protein, arsR family [Clostridium collagenovorans DSM 3089]|uniref:Regulatory protein, arsR family n=1 Tax=Clostridium collagenovorans DSM 3089 TaxID=1121306 RepID=A0A1M5U7Q4_9CLOT|nr:metalloregulator ArsR/SmtB family transcription factor [Clostridium collagenovorans]SHH58994.1 regulatory protein, arsR family [Clostridium collagenovorans DSM 3089]